MKKEDSYLQFFTTLLAYSLPVLQFFFSQLSDPVKSIFIFKDYFLVVSTFTAVISYVTILVFRSTPWFNWAPFQARRKHKNLEWNTYTDKALYAEDEIKAYQAKHKPPKALRSIQTENIIQKLFLPLMSISFVIFIVIGFVYSPTNQTGHFKVSSFWDIILLVIQAMSYAVFIVAAVLSFAHQYLRESGLKKYKKQRTAKYERAIELARQRDSFGERKRISFLTHRETSDNAFNAIHAFIVKVENRFYVIVADAEIDAVTLVKEYSTLEEAENFVWGSPTPNEGAANG